MTMSETPPVTANFTILPYTGVGLVQKLYMIYLNILSNVLYAVNRAMVLILPVPAKVLFF